MTGSAAQTQNPCSVLGRDGHHEHFFNTDPLRPEQGETMEDFPEKLHSLNLYCGNDRTQPIIQPSWVTANGHFVLLPARSLGRAVKSSINKEVRKLVGK